MNENENPMGIAPGALTCAVIVAACLVLGGVALILEALL